MATLSIPEEILKAAGLTERDATVEFACRLFEARKLSLHLAAKLAGLSRPAMEEALLQRGIPIYRPTPQDFADDLETLRHLKGTP